MIKLKRVKLCSICYKYIDNKGNIVSMPKSIDLLSIQKKICNNCKINNMKKYEKELTDVIINNAALDFNIVLSVIVHNYDPDTCKREEDLLLLEIKTDGTCNIDFNRIGKVTISDEIKLQNAIDFWYNKKDNMITNIKSIIDCFDNVPLDKTRVSVYNKVKRKINNIINNI